MMVILKGAAEKSYSHIETYIIIYLCNSDKKSYSHIETYIIVFQGNSVEKSYNHIETYIVYIYVIVSKSHKVVGSNASSVWI